MRGRVQDFGCRVRASGFWDADTPYVCPRGLGYRSLGAGFGILGVGFWVLSFRVWRYPVRMSQGNGV